MTKGAAVTERGRLWIENQPPDSRKGATIGWVRRYQAADGQLYAVLLSAYLLLTLVPVFLVTASYIYKDPTALADRIEHRLRLHGTTAELFSSVMLGTGEHKFSAVLIAIVDLFFFGLGFARVLAARARPFLGDRPAASRCSPTRRGMWRSSWLWCSGLALFVVETKALRGEPSWIGWVLDLVWLALLLAFFVWAPRSLLHHRVTTREPRPGRRLHRARPRDPAADLRCCCSPTG